jgi:organic hydroperoxide reductase OsmC/OhrA
MHTADIVWSLADGEEFLGNKYSRSHEWKFDGGVTVPASASPLVVPEPMSNPHAVDPEEALVASLASCHMLWFLSIARKNGFAVSSYSDSAKGMMGANSAGRIAMLRVELSPRTLFTGDNQPSREQIESMHHEAHESCFVANSVTTEVVCNPFS